MMVTMVKNILVHGKLNISIKELNKEWGYNGLQEKVFIMDNLNKINRDRQFAEDTLRATLHEIKAQGTFESLMSSVAEEMERKSRYKVAQEKEVAARKELRQLQRQLTSTKKGMEQEIHEMTEMIAHLKDQLQEMKSKSNLESKYVKKSADNNLDMNSTLKNIEETELKVKILMKISDFLIKF